MEKEIEHLKGPERRFKKFLFFKIGTISESSGVSFDNALT
jgi:hypothetical protein